jgi:hypothetical protein
MQEINPNFTVTFKGESIDIEVVGEFLKSLQLVTLNIAESIENMPAKKTGSFNSALRKKYSLSFKNLSYGSVVLELSPPAEGVKVISELKGTLGAANSGNFSDLEERFNGNERAKRTVSALKKMYTSVEAYKVGLIFPTAKFDLNPDAIDGFTNYLQAHPAPEKTSVSGRLVGITVNENRSAKLETTSGSIIIKYPKESEEEFISELKKHLKEIVQINGLLEQKRTVQVLSLDKSSLKSFSPVISIPISSFRLDGDIILLSDPVDFSIRFEEDMYILSNDELDLYSADKTLEKAFKEIQYDLGVLWKEYVKAPESELTKDAIEFRELLKRRLLRK